MVFNGVRCAPVYPFRSREVIESLCVGQMWPQMCKTRASIYRDDSPEVTGSVYTDYLWYNTGQSCCYDFIWYLGSTTQVTVTNEGSIGIPEPKNLICFLWLLLGFGEYPYDTGRIPHPKASMQAERRQLAVLLDAAACVTFPRCFWTTVPLFPPLGYQSWAHFLVCLKGGVFGPQISHPWRIQVCIPNRFLDIF